MYKVTAEKSFDGAHFLAGHEGKCRNIHGHRWRVIVTVQSETVPINGKDEGMVVDFAELKLALQKEVDFFDHALIFQEGTLKCVNELYAEGFLLCQVDFRPTAENFAKHFFVALKKQGYKISQVQVYETPENCAVYCE
jgi:6-pyruvoyltetrahydropterin/6-carboxytetrahydropterin synthase